MIATSFFFHIIKIKENLSKCFIPLKACVKNILRSDSQRQCSRVHNFHSVWIEFYKNMPAHSVRTMNNSVYKKLSNYFILVSIHSFTVKCIWNFIIFFPIRYITPNCINKFFWRHVIITVHKLVDFNFLCIVFDNLYSRRGS